MLSSLDFQYSLENETLNSPLFDLSVELAEQYRNTEFGSNFNNAVSLGGSTLSTDSIINFDILDEQDIDLDVLLNQDLDLVDSGTSMMIDINSNSNKDEFSRSDCKNKRKNKHLSVLPYNIYDIVHYDDTLVEACLKNEDLARGKPGDRLFLNDEEKQLLIRDGHAIPTHLPLTKMEERALKSVRRKIRNKISAKNSRAKKDSYLGGLEKRIVQCSKENVMLKQRLSELEKDKMSLFKQVLNLRNELSKLLPNSSATGTSLMLIILTFMIILCPMLDPRQLFGKSIINNDQSNNIKHIFPGRTRMLLQESEASIELGEPYMVTVRASPPWRMPPESPAIPLHPIYNHTNISVKVTKPIISTIDH